jgi:diguanylate cyclase (GGDEF)-like protein/PAS domain S-box-containing protein
MGVTAELVRVLVVEDDENDYVLTRDMLASQEPERFEVEWCPDYESALAAIAGQRHDIYLVDYRLGERTGLELVSEAFSLPSSAPVIALTGRGDHAVDLEASALGFTDFLVKSELDPVSLERSIRYALAHHQTLRALARSEERYALAVRAASAGIWDWDLVDDRMYLSPRWNVIFGLPEYEGEQPPEAWFELVHPDDLPALRDTIDAHLRGDGAHLESETRMRHRDGSWRWMLVRGLAIRDANGVASRLAGSVLDVTERRVAEDQLRDGALHDSLTGLPNRALFIDRVDQVLRRAARDPDVGCAVLFIDINSFKLVNDGLSHAAGDRLLIALASRISSAVRPGDTTARLGGDEFTVLLDGICKQAQALAIIARLQGEIAKLFRVDGHELTITASIGVAFNVPAITAAEMLRNADIAMYDAKRDGLSGVSIFNEHMHSRLMERVALEADLRKAVDESLLGVHYQPIVDLRSGRVCALEALARWPEQWPAIATQDFIAVAEQTGLIAPLGLHVLQTALAALADWRQRGLIDENIRMTVNVSGRQLEDPALPAKVQAALHQAGLTANALILEITESTLMDDPNRMQAMVTALCETGVGLYLDDYGTGYSSLSALHRYPVDALKIDRSFISSSTDKTSGSDVIVRSTVALAHSLGLDVVAEGIETHAQLRLLQASDCQYGQGYLFAKPLAHADTERLLKDWSSPWATPPARAPSN